MDGILEKHKNTFSIIIPGLSQVGVLARLDSSSIEHERLDKWTMTPDGMRAHYVSPLSFLTFSPEICDGLEEGLLKLSRHVTVNRYIPNLNWNQLEEDIGLSSLLRHLLVPKAEGDSDVKQDSSQILGMILEVLEISSDDFTAEVPFTAYGLDSLGATRIAQALRPYTNVTQMQLLGGMSWDQLQERLKTAENTAKSKKSLTAPMTDMVAKYTKDFATHIASVPVSVEGDVVLITGTTGAVGASVLAQLVDCSAVSRVYALNRKASNGKSLHDRQREVLQDKGLDPNVCDSVKVVLLEGDLTAESFGLDLSTFEEVTIMCCRLYSSTTNLRL